MKTMVPSLIIALFLAGCAAPILPQSPPPPTAPVAETAEGSEKPSDSNQDLFLLGLDELLVGGSSTSLSLLAADGNAGVWQERARNLLAWSRRCPQPTRESDGVSQQLRACQAGSELLVKENTALKSDLSQLKRILVEMETRKQ